MKKIRNIHKRFEQTLYKGKTNKHMKFFSTLYSLGTWHLKAQEDTIIYTLCNTECLKRLVREWHGLICTTKCKIDS